MDQGGRPDSRSAQRVAFEIYLRTGRRIAADEIETKFNPWHDSLTGQFTFVGRGRYFGRGSRTDGKRTGGGGRAGSASGNQSAPPSPERDPKNPLNHSVYTVQKGDTLTSVAAQRRGLRVSDLAWLNDLPADQKLRVGQKLKLPHQEYLEARRDEKNKILALAYYLETHNGVLPHDPANPPSLSSQVLDSDWRRVNRNGYAFWIDPIGRPRRIKGELTDGLSARSRRNQARAGGSDRRRPGDDGGHYIAVRFNGPIDAFNHFAQDSGFNRGSYRAIEDSWARDKKAGRRVWVDIKPHYEGFSERPASLSVTWYVDGKRFERDLPNEKKGK